MKKNLLLVFLVLLGFSSFAQDNIPEKPSPPKLVNDYTGTLSSDEQDQLERKLVAYNDSTSTQIAVVIVKSLNDYEVADFGARLFNKWNIGQSKENNGVLLLISIGDRKVNITTGYGAEPYITDAYSRRIIETQLTPNFKNNNYYRGIDEATNSLMALLSGNFEALEKEKKFPVGLIAIIMIIVLIIIFSKNNGGGGYTYSKGGRRAFQPPVFFPMGGGGGFGGGFGGGGGGGGFGGFGGGFSGGGGASGSW